MTQVALVWYIYQRTKSPTELGFFLLTYSGPVIIGGILAGILLDRFDRRKVMIADNLFRGLVVGLVPIMASFGYLALWELYVVSGIYGFLKMIPLAGTPSIIPDMVDEEGLSAANSLETIGYTVAGVLGPVLAGILISHVGPTGVMAFDAISYGVFAVSLLMIRIPSPADYSKAGKQKAGVGQAVMLLRSNVVLLSTTIMFFVFNFGFGFFSVWLPVFVSRLPGGGAATYGVILGVLAIGELVGSILSGVVLMKIPTGARICIAQFLSGISLLLVFLGTSTAVLGTAVFAMGVISAPLTVWAQTLRMKIIPGELRGRTFALLRTLMQSSGPLANGIAGLCLPATGIVGMLILSAALIALPGVLGYQVRTLRTAA